MKGHGICDSMALKYISLHHFFSSDSAAFQRGLAGVAFFYEDYVCSLVFCKNSSSGGEVIIFLRFGLFKTSCGCTLKKKFESAWHMKCPQTQKLFLKSAFALFELVKCQRLYQSAPMPQTVCQNTKHIHIVTKLYPGAAGKALNVGARNWCGDCLGFQLRELDKLEFVCIKILAYIFSLQNPMEPFCGLLHGNHIFHINSHGHWLNTLY